MKPTGNRCLMLAALMTVLIIFSCAAHGQEREKDANGDGAIREASAAADSVRPASKTARPAALINFVPADIFAEAVEAPAVAMPYFPIIITLPPVVKDAAREGESLADLARKLHNPVSPLPRISFESNLDFGLAGNREGYRYTMKLEPVIPFALNRNWNLISRTEMPFVQQDGVVASTVQAGFGDILQTFFLSPNKQKPGFWGVGTTLLIPTATDTLLGSGKFGLGPALVAGKQHRRWSYGALVRQIWSVAGHRDRADVRSTYIQPFVTYTTSSAWSFSLDSQSTRDWVAEQWSVPVHFEVAKVVRFGGHPVSVGAAVTCWAASAPGGPQACGARFTVTPLFPPK